MRIRNQSIFADMANNEAKQASEERKLIAQQQKAERDMAQLPGELSRQGVTNPVVIMQRMLELHLRNQAAIAATKIELAGLETEYENLAASVEKYGESIKESFVSGFANALTQSITDFKNAGDVWKQLAKSISDEIVGTFTKAFTERIFKNLNMGWIDSLMNKIFGGGGMSTGQVGLAGAFRFAEGGPVRGVGTGTSDSIPAMLSAGEHIMPAAKAQKWMPLLEGIRLGTIAPLAMGGVVGLQSIADLSLISRRYAGGGVVVSDGGASNVTPGSGGGGNMIISLHPDALNMTMRDWLEHEVVRQQGRR